MNYIREKISGKKNRLKQNNYNLDMTYITNRIIAMAYPASGFESIYRNNINDVSNYFREAHDINYLVINLSGRKYDYSKFNKMVLEFAWEDHHAPQLSILFQICDLIHKFLIKNVQNVVVIHCLAGKGRTGVAICCYLMYCGRFKTSEDALLYYATKRFKVKGLGVTQPCQIKYVGYFHEIFNNPYTYPQIKYIKQIQMHPIPSFRAKNSCKPIIKIFQVAHTNVLYNNKNDKHKDQLIYKGYDISYAQDQIQYIKFDQDIILAGDIIMKIHHSNYYSKTKMFRLTFNVGFIKDNKIELSLFDLDPDSVMFDSRFQQNFNVKIEFQDACKCTNKTKFTQKCQFCLKYLQQEKINWGLIQEILSQYDQPTPQISSTLLFGNQDMDDVNHCLETEKQKHSDSKSTQSDIMFLMRKMFDEEQFDQYQKSNQKTINELENKEKLNYEIKTRINKTQEKLTITKFQM